ncbi:MAG: hypothetical protein IKS21_07055 [Oscillospiraceae bacterium]|nr:hypothetical protein [Oscillospiraceae bacterium]
MKHFLMYAVLLSLSLLLLTCCALWDEPKESVPTGSYHYVVTAPSRIPNETVDFAQGDQTVKRVMNYEGEIPLSYPTKVYRYQLPMIDLPDSYTTACNQEIEALFGAKIRSSLQAMERQQEPKLESVTYFSFVHGEILTLRIDERSCNGEVSHTYYTVNAQTGKEIHAEEMLAQVGIGGEPEQVLNQRVTDLFASRFGPLEGADVDYTTALNRTQMALSPVTAKCMHLTESGRLILALTLYHPTGEITLEEIPLP